MVKLSQLKKMQRFLADPLSPGNPTDEDVISYALHGLIDEERNYFSDCHKILLELKSNKPSKKIADDIANQVFEVISGVKESLLIPGGWLNSGSENEQSMFYEFK